MTVVLFFSEISFWSLLQVPVDHFCYAKCIGKEGKLNSVVDNEDVSFSEEFTSSFKRIKREIPGSEKNNGDACLMNSPGTFMHPDTKVTFQEPKDSGSFMANVTWEPLLSDAFNWTGYRLIYAVGMVSEAILKCVDFYKVVSIPFSSSHSNFTVSIDCHIPCHEKPTISGISTLNTTIVTSPSAGIVASPTKAPSTSPTSDSSRLNIVLASTLPTVAVCVVAALLIFFYYHRLQKKGVPKTYGLLYRLVFSPGKISFTIC
ncbi:hypothetical protein AWC38_SpisGene21027 [Stylophora pistillata]|uniref:Uncharacterized protein n=1 Tax=Stylophora pistillata TaxID=50429 RepID=A0A2B4RCC7_STYPI|nr:hypothetical protein AWC38_SpisGene21027 [Stylophora pistillata]